MPQTSIDAIRKFVSRGLLIRFDPGTVFGNTNAHFGVVVNADPSKQEAVVVVCASSKVEKLVNFAAMRGLSPNTIVRITGGTHPHFGKDTAFDCNRPERVSYSVLATWLASGKIELPFNDDIIDDTLLAEISAGVMISDLVAPDIQAMLR